MLEVELKFRLADETALREQLKPFAVLWDEPQEQVDCYFNHPARDFAQTDEAVRLRRMGEDNVITYKGPKLDTATKTRREIELAIAGGSEGLAGFGELLEALSFRRVAEVRKMRTKGHFHWQGFAVELGLDEVTGLGRFVEIEIQAADDLLPQARQAILELAAALQLGESERRSYLRMLLNLSGQ